MSGEFERAIKKNAKILYNLCTDLWNKQNIIADGIVYHKLSEWIPIDVVLDEHRRYSAENKKAIERAYSERDEMEELANNIAKKCREERGQQKQKLQELLEKFPSCEQCDVFIQTKNKANRALICETARACGECPFYKLREKFGRLLQK